MKKLISRTIVPNEFYVERKADSQLINTINEMGRPASILVSRQMGKTNLLLNTKRNLQNNYTKFIYIDLSSTTFKTIRDCFRYIIDIAIDTEDIFQNLEQSILESRKIEKLANREHEKELLLLLKHLKGKLIIILDEIDSMTKYDFSDQFFSQIRSIYFASRTNYEEFNNLTYILSGVLEPSEIIQDKTKSPFNISEKIYLNDFDKNEYLTFLNKINLEFFNEEIIEKIYEWTNGHPRITWDVCSKLEDIYLEKNYITIDTVNEIINDLYFIHESRPPIDNIKQIIKEDTSLAQIILDIKQNIYLNITDSIKNKLYLFGVIEIKDTDKIVLKNKIIEENLNEDFLKNILYSESSAYEIANKYFNKGSYSEAIVEYIRFLSQENIDENENNVANINAGLCLYYLSDYPQALNHMNMVKVNKEKDPLNYYINQVNKGLVFFSMHDFQNSLKVFIEALESKDDILYIKSLFYIAQNYFYIEKTTVKPVFVSKIDETIQSIEKEIEKKSFSINNKNIILEVLTNSYYLKANYLNSIKNIEDAIIYFKKIIDIDIDIFKPTIYLSLVKLDKNHTDFYLEEIFKIIKDKKLKIDIFNDLKFSVIDIYMYVLELLNFEKDILLNEFLNYCSNTYNEFFKSKCDVLINSGYYFIKENQRDNGLKIYNYALSFEEKEIAFKLCYKNLYLEILSVYFNDDDIDNIKITYFKFINNIIVNNLQKDLSKDDLFYLSQTLLKLLHFKKLNEVKIALESIEKNILTHLDPTKSIYKITFIDIRYRLSEDTNSKLLIATNCLNTIKEHNSLMKEIPDDLRTYIKNIEKSHYKFVKFSSNKIVTAEEKRIPRNELCNCGSKLKYKKCCGKNK